MFTQNSPKGRPIMFLHGDLQNSTVFSKLEIYFREKGYVTFAPDLPGHGSNASEQHPLLFVESYISEKGITNPIIIGHSSGCLLAVEYLLKTQNASALVLISSSFLNPLALVPDLEDKKEYYKSLSQQFFKKQELLDYQEIPEDKILQAGMETTNPKAFAALIDFYTSLPLDRPLEGIQQPCLLILGNQDAFIPSQKVQLQASRISKSRCVVLNTGHNPVLTNYSEVEKSISDNLDFLTG